MSDYNFAYLDEQTKRMIRRALLKAVAIPGYQVPFASREMPMPYGWGTGGVQVSAAVLTPEDRFKVIDQGADVIGQHVDTPTPQLVAQENGVYGTGHHRDFREFAPKATVCSSVWVWDRFLKNELEKIIAGNWVPAPHGALLSMKEGGTDIACCGPTAPVPHSCCTPSSAL